MHKEILGLTVSKGWSLNQMKPNELFALLSRGGDRAHLSESPTLAAGDSHTFALEKEPNFGQTVDSSTHHWLGQCWHG